MELWRLGQRRDKRLGALQRGIEIIHAEGQQQPIAWGGAAWIGQGGVVVVAPAMQAKQHFTVVIAELPEIVVARHRLALA